MKNLYTKSDITHLTDRIKKLHAATNNHWGKMNVSQMLAHCSAVLEAASGITKPKRSFIGRFLGPLLKSAYIGEKPFGKNSPTDKHFLITDNRDFSIEKHKVIQLMTLFYNNGKEKCTKHPHPFFGKLPPNGWSAAMYKHIDHHLKQFGV